MITAFEIQEITAEFLWWTRRLQPRVDRLSPEHKKAEQPEFSGAVVQRLVLCTNEFFSKIGELIFSHLY